MHFLSTHKWLTFGLVLFIVIVAVLLWQVLYITKHFTASVPAPNIPRTAEHFGASGPVLNVVVLGDSTSIAQGAAYDQGFARQSAHLLAAKHQVSMTNVGISGARTADIVQKQLQKAVALKPDLAIIAIGANDVTHLTSLGSIRRNITTVITELHAANPHMHIILTGSPAMGSVSRFAPPTQWIAGARVRQVNAVFADVAADENVTLLPLAQKTGYAFKHNPALFASDNFHPNAAGYAVWQPVVTTGLQQTGLLAH